MASYRNSTGTAICVSTAHGGVNRRFAVGSGRPGSLLTLVYPTPQIRTCGFCRIRLLDKWLRYARRRVPAGRAGREGGATHPHAGWPVRLSVGVSLRRNPTSVCWPSFPPTGPPAGAPFPPRRVVARIVTGPHDAHRQDPHRPMRDDTGRPRAVIRCRISQPRTASLPCPAGLRARRPSPMVDLSRKNAFSTRP